MKKLVEITEEGLETHMGERMTFFCMNYIYTGVLAGVNEMCVLLTDAHIVYETGSFKEKGWKDAQKLPHDAWYVQLASIESWGHMK